VLDSIFSSPSWVEWIEAERKVRDQSLQRGRRLWKRHKDKSPTWWWETCGLTEEDLKLLD